MSFKDFTLDEVIDRFQLEVVERSLFPSTPDLAPSAWLTETLAETVPLALSLGNEKARSELIIAPILVEVRRSLEHRVSLFSGVSLDVDASVGLNGVCDWLLSRSPEQLRLRAPVVAIVEAKQENIRAGLGQCVAEMIAALRFNERAKSPITRVNGAVTTGDSWRFVALSGTALELDTDQYLFTQIAKILGIFRAILTSPTA